MKLLIRAALFAAFLITTAHAQQSQPNPRKPKPKEGTTPAKPKPKPKANTPAQSTPMYDLPEKAEPQLPSYKCNVVVKNAKSETSSIVKENVPGANDEAAQQGCLQALNVQTTIREGKPVVTVEHPDTKERVEAAEVSVEKQADPPPATTEAVAPPPPAVVLPPPPPKEPPRKIPKTVYEYCGKIKNNNVAAALQMPVKDSPKDMVEELKKSGFTHELVTPVNRSHASYDRHIPVGAVLVLDKKPGSSCPLPGGKPMLSVKCDYDHITWPGQSKKLLEFLNENRDCVAYVLTNPKLPEVKSGLRAGPPTPQAPANR